MKDESIFWNKLAKKYSAKPVPSEKLYQEKLKLTRELLTKEMKVLEIGCGTGTTALIHAPNVSEITGTDFSKEMIKIANEKVIFQKLENILFKQESIQEMSYPDSEFDIIMAHSILHLVEGRKNALKKIFNSIKPGGYFVTSTTCIAGVWKIFKPIWFLGFKIGKLPYIGFFSKNKFISEVKECGFTIEKEWCPTKMDVFLIAKKGE